MKFYAVPHETWLELYEDSGTKAALCRIEDELAGAEFYPLPEDVLRFMTTDLSKVRYVLVGQDPYCSYDEKGNHPQATGRCFEVHELIGKSWDYQFKQASLRNILKAVYFTQTGEVVGIGELRKLIKEGSFAIAPPSDWFDSLEKQGMLFLNATLTVSPGNPGGHKELWKCYMEQVVEYIERENPGARWVLWGEETRKLCKNHLTTHAYNTAIISCHPARHEFVQGSGLEEVNLDLTGLSQSKRDYH